MNQKPGMPDFLAAMANCFPRMPDWDVGMSNWEGGMPDWEVGMANIFPEVVNIRQPMPDIFPAKADYFGGCSDLRHGPEDFTGARTSCSNIGRFLLLSALVRIASLRIAMLLGCLWLGGCASKPLPKFQKPIARAQVQRVRTTAYTHSEADHVRYGRQSALGTRLESEGVKSAAADWSRWPAGTLFRIRETGELYRVDDYGWALSGTNTIDLYKSTRAEMNAWGVRHVTIENLEWGSPSRSLSILKSRSKYRHVKRMVAEYRHEGMRFPTLAPLEPPAGTIAGGPQSVALTPFR